MVRTAFLSSVAAIIIASMSLAFARAESEADALNRAASANKKRDFTAAVDIYVGLDEPGSPAGSRFLGLMYWAGAGVEKDHARACDLYDKAARVGDALATELLGDCYFNGDGRVATI
ncbi:MAG: uncharacterized protein QOH65_1562 [Methylobacteriaceae bacterium]|jgi:TPR repeat protein|nr:uncharacterized protein [Methylobacteriaceae bacterium]